MRSLLALTGLVATSMFLTAAPNRQVATWPFVEVTEGMVIPASGESKTTLEGLLTQYSDLADVHILWSDDTSGLLKSAWIPNVRDIQVPATEVHKVVEAILIQNDFVLTISNDQPPYMLEVQSLNSSARTNIRQAARFVPVNEMPNWRKHPAYLVHTAVSLSYVDGRTLTNSMRAMLTDANTQSIIPVGNSNSIILTGFAPQIADMVEILQRVDLQRKEHLENFPPPAPKNAEDK